MELKPDKIIIPLFIIVGVSLIYKGIQLNEKRTNSLKNTSNKKSYSKPKVHRQLSSTKTNPKKTLKNKIKKTITSFTPNDPLTKAVSISTEGEMIGPNGLVCQQSSCLVMDTIKGKVSFYDLDKKSLFTLTPQFKYIKNGLIHKNNIHVIHGQFDAQISTYNIQTKKWTHTQLPLKFEVLNNIVSDMDSNGNISLQVGSEYYSIQSDKSVLETPGRPLNNGHNFVQVWMPEFNQFVVNITDKEGRVTLSHQLERDYESIDNYIVQEDIVYIVFTKAGSVGKSNYSYVVEKVNTQTGNILGEVSFSVQGDVHIETPVSIDKRSGQITFTDYVDNKLKIETVHL